MNIDIQITQALQEAQMLLQDIESELHFLQPHFNKNEDIRNMVLWLKGGEPIAKYKPIDKELPPLKTGPLEFPEWGDYDADKDPKHAVLLKKMEEDNGQK